MFSALHWTYTASVGCVKNGRFWNTSSQKPPFFGTPSGTRRGPGAHRAPSSRDRAAHARCSRRSWNLGWRQDLVLSGLRSFSRACETPVSAGESGIGPPLFVNLEQVAGLPVVAAAHPIQDRVDAPLGVGFVGEDVVASVRRGQPGHEHVEVQPADEL